MMKRPPGFSRSNTARLNASADAPLFWIHQGNEVGRNGVDVLTTRLTRECPHHAERIVLEMNDLSRHDAVDPAFGSYNVREETGPVAAARVNVDDGRAGIDAREPD